MITPKYKARVTRISVLPEKQPIFCEQCTHISIEDEAAGEFLEITQQSGSSNLKEQAIMIEPREWEAIKQSVETLLKEIEDNKPLTSP